MAYDAAIGTVVLFGGRNGGHFFTDTWTWNGSTWTQQAPATSPTPRLDPTMAYDAGTSNMVLFGGLGTTASPFLRDTPVIILRPCRNNQSSRAAAKWRSGQGHAPGAPGRAATRHRDCRGTGPGAWLGAPGRASPILAIGARAHPGLPVMPR
jgi:hypothetical protein